MANVAVSVGLADGSTWSLTILTVGEAGRLLIVRRETGEAAHGSYLWVSDQLIVQKRDIKPTKTASRDLVPTAAKSPTLVFCSQV